MKKIILGLFLLNIVFGFQTIAQDLVENDLIGKWRVVEVQSLLDSFPQDNKEILDSIKIALLKSKFEFKADKNFSLDIDFFEEMQIKNGYWKFDSLTKSVIIQDWKDKDLNGSGLMDMEIRKDSNNTMYFIIEPIYLLKMEKE